MKQSTKNKIFGFLNKFGFNFPVQTLSFDDSFKVVGDTTKLKVKETKNDIIYTIKGNIFSSTFKLLKVNKDKSILYSKDLNLTIEVPNDLAIVLFGRKK